MTMQTLLKFVCIYGGDFFPDCQVIAKLKWGHFSFGKYEDGPVKGVEYVHITIEGHKSYNKMFKTKQNSPFVHVIILLKLSNF